MSDTELAGRRARILLVDDTATDGLVMHAGAGIRLCPVLLNAVPA